MRLDCSSAVLRALAVAHESIALHGDELAPRMLMAALLHDPDGAPALLAASCGLVPGAWNAGANEILVNEPAQQTISDLAPPLRILVRHAGILFREAFQEGDILPEYCYEKQIKSIEYYYDNYENIYKQLYKLFNIILKYYKYIFTYF